MEATTYRNTETDEVVEVVEAVGRIVRVRNPERPGHDHRYIPADIFAATYEEI